MLIFNLLEEFQVRTSGFNRVECIFESLFSFSLSLDLLALSMCLVETLLFKFTYLGGTSVYVRSRSFDG